ncbi:hypothetical protein ACFP81_08250 [Deinococcus lacus]|uniref:Uncharacterized protein n=1 Tax=Deinococcus lacus TaxID=392561 RepID=A0ABW1YD33_9DEIO
MSEIEIVKNFRQPDSWVDDETSYFRYRWFDIALRNRVLIEHEWHMRGDTALEIDGAPLELFGLKPRNEDNADRLLAWLEKRHLIHSKDERHIKLDSGVVIKYNIFTTRENAKQLGLYIESNLSPRSLPKSL